MNEGIVVTVRTAVLSTFFSPVDWWGLRTQECPRENDHILETFIVKIDKARRVLFSLYERETTKIVFVLHVASSAH
jgi:hypothetical protein